MNTRRIEWFLVGVGACALAAWGATVGAQMLGGRLAVEAFEREVETFEREIGALDPSMHDWSAARVERYEQAPSGVDSRPIALLEIERLGLDAPIFSGTDESTLDRGVGHVQGTPAPGQAGNVGLAGHRDSFFRSLRHVRHGDVVRVLTRDGKTTEYEVLATEVVSPADTSVLDSSDDRRLTLVTCFPFYHVGNAPDRFIVHARAIESQQPELAD